MNIFVNDKEYDCSLEQLCNKSYHFESLAWDDTSELKIYIS